MVIFSGENWLGQAKIAEENDKHGAHLHFYNLPLLSKHGWNWLYSGIWGKILLWILVIEEWERNLPSIPEFDDRNGKEKEWETMRGGGEMS